MQPPRSYRQLKCFLGMVNYYRDMWPRRSHILAPLNDLAGKRKKKDWKWSNIEQQAFLAAKNMLIKEAMLNYPDFSKPFHIHSDASDLQLGAVISQNNKPLAYYTRKLNSAQQNYTVGEKELLGIVEGLKAFENILRGQVLIIHTDHLNLLYAKNASQRMMRWRLLVEEYGPKEIHHVKGEDNSVADCLSRMDMEPSDFDTIQTEQPQVRLEYCKVLTEMVDNLYITPHNEEIDDHPFPVAPEIVQKAQSECETLVALQTKDKTPFAQKEVEGFELVHYKNKIYIPLRLTKSVTKWYHEILVHPGTSRLEATLRQHYWWPLLRSDVESCCKHCHECQLSKKQRKKYGKLPAKQAERKIWNRVNVDLWGPATIKNKNGTHSMHLMTMIDPVSCWFEVATIKSPSSFECQRVFDSVWLSRYPRPREVGCDGGNEFNLYFADLCKNFNLKKCKSGAWNPQANAILERVHQVLGNCLRTFDLEEADLSDDNPFDEFLAATAYAIRSTVHTTLGASPGQLVFGRDMILPITYKADWAVVTNRKQQRINKSNTRENSKRIDIQYTQGDKVLLTRPGILPKLSRPRKGPYTITEVHTNGTVTIQKGPAVTDRVNIRRLVPYFED